jgi:broad specificity phosphatase PhoE
MTQLLLIRHGQSTWNAIGRIQGWADPPLDETGREQAHKLASRLVAEEHNIAALYSSPLLRAGQTAEAIGHALGLAVQADDRLKENNVGQITGLNDAEVNQHFPEWVAQFNRPGNEYITPPGGEDRDHFVRRAAAAMADIVARHPDQTVVVVSHGGTLGVYLAHLMEIPIRRRLPFQFDNASVSIVRVTEQRVRLLKFNDTWHLANGHAGHV